MLRLCSLALVAVLFWIPAAAIAAPGSDGAKPWQYSTAKKWNKNYKKRKSYKRSSKKKRYSKNKKRNVWNGGGKPYITPQQPSVVSFARRYKTGSIVIDTAGRSLYYVLSSGRAYKYPIAVGKPGFAWTGVKRITAKKNWPDWHPPKEMRQRKPELPVRMTGGIKNPLGAKALYLGSSLYRIHGTNNAASIGTASSSGCFRMTNAHVTHLSQIAGVGTQVHVVRSLGGKKKWKSKKRKSKRYSKKRRSGYRG